MSQQQPHIRPQEEEINLREELEKYLHYWPWFVVTVILCLALAVAYLKFTTPVYTSTASIIIKDDDSKSPSSALADFADLGLLDGLGTNSIENEMGILRSRRMMNSVVKELDLDVQYYNDQGIRPVELYDKVPYRLKVLKIDYDLLAELLEEDEVQYDIKEISSGKFEITNSVDGKSWSADEGGSVNLGFAVVTVFRNESYDFDSEDVLNEELVRFSLPEEVVANYREKLDVVLVDDKATLIEMKLQDPVKAKARDILDQLILEYNRDAIEDKNLVARNTAKFIDERLGIINKELDSVETGKESFKEKNQLTDIKAESELFITNASEYNKKQQQVGTQLELANAMLDYLENDKKSDLLPANLGIEEDGVNEQIKEYNSLVLERNRILSGSTEKNPVVLKLNGQIDQLKENVQESLSRMKANLKIAEKELGRQTANIDSQISSVPSKERQYRGIERQQNIKEALYLFLLQKREENSLSLAVTAPKAKIVDRAYSSKEPVSPKSKIVLLAALILGLLIPFLVIYIKNLLNNKVRSRADLERVSKEIPIVGEVPRVARGEAELIEAAKDRTVLAESFRILHTNLQYLLINSGDKRTGVKIFITSTVKGEGKTFAAFNLAMTLANTGKKVIVVGGDLRNPQLQRYEAQTREMLGVSDYLVNDSYKLEQLIKQSELHENLQLLSSGSIPPNPAELWRQDKTSALFAELEARYDYIIVDTAPAMLVADTFLINKYADLTLYMVRAGYTEKKLQDFAVDAKKDGKLHDVGFVLNDVELANFGYGNKYGYTYGQEKTSLWQKVRSKAAIW